MPQIRPPAYLLVSIRVAEPEIGFPLPHGPAESWPIHGRRNSDELISSSTIKLCNWDDYYTRMFGGVIAVPQASQRGIRVGWVTKSVGGSRL